MKILGLFCAATTLLNLFQSVTDTNSEIKFAISQMKPLLKIENELYTDTLYDKQSPFILRKFAPNLNDKIIYEAISYGCYREGQAPGIKGPSEDEILEDLKILKEHWNLIRIYGSDEDSERVLNVIKKHKLPFKVMLGVWLENETKNPQRKSENIKQVLKAVELGSEFEEQITAINVANESQVYWSAHRMEMYNLVKYVRAVRNNTSVPVTVADDYNFWNKKESRKVADEIDFIVTHIYALWNGKTLDNAIQWMDSIYYDVLSTMHPDKIIAIGETGWATDYDPEKSGPGEQGSLIKGDVSLSAQENYLHQIHKWINDNKVTTFLFEAFDEPWKGGGENSGPNEIEKNWGLYYKDRSPKESFINFLNNKSGK
ncbi:MAG: hypothetical protein JW995_04535 [Melioribacteraceae bacterium]|nr:hypothetical protein [Melioribacteraceae bacterium]